MLSRRRRQGHGQAELPRPQSTGDLLGVAVIVIAALAVNLVVQRLIEPTRPAGTGCTGSDRRISTPSDTAAMDTLASSIPPRVISTDEIPTGAIDHGVSPAFTNNPVQPMPSTFSAQTAADASSVPVTDATAEPSATPAIESDGTTQVATIDPSAITPTATPAVGEQPAGATVELPPDKIGPMELRQAAADGDPHAQFEVAAIYSEGRAVPQDYAAAATWYQHAADHGFAPAEYRLGSLYESGKGVTKDLQDRRESGTRRPPRPATACRCTTSLRSMPAGRWGRSNSTKPPNGSSRRPTSASSTASSTSACSMRAGSVCRRASGFVQVVQHRGDQRGQGFRQGARRHRPLARCGDGG